MKINVPATHNAIRGKYRSMQKAAVAFGVTKRTLYLTINGGRGGKTHPAPKSEAIMKRLREESLLVYLPESPEGQVVNQ